MRILVWRSLCVVTSDFDLELNVRTRPYLFDLEKSFSTTPVLALLVRICKIVATLFHKSVLFFKLSTWVLFSLVFSSKTILHVHQNQLQFKDLRPARWKVKIVLYLVTWNYLFFDYFQLVGLSDVMKQPVVVKSSRQNSVLGFFLDSFKHKCHTDIIIIINLCFPIK